MKVEIKIPSLGESITEATISKIFKENGSFVEVDEEVIELETDKVNQVINASESGELILSVKISDTVKVGQSIGFIDTEKKGVQTEKKREEPKKEDQKPLEKNSVSSKNIRQTEEEYLKAKEGFSEVSLPPVCLPSSDIKRERETKVPMTKLRKIIAKRLVEVKNQTAMLTTFNEIDMSCVMNFRKKEKEAFEKKHQVKLGFMSFFIKASVSALQKYKEINAYISDEEIVYRHYFDIGVAVGTDKGLMVPVLKDCDKKNFSQIEKELKQSAEKARAGSLSIENLKGGGFTITNGGVYGSLLSTPILNPPQSAILGMHTILDRPIAIEKKVEIRPMMYVALSYDHRIVDGQEAIGFLVHIKNSLEDPTRLLMDL